MTFLCANGSNWGGISRFRNNHELFERFLGLPSNGNLDNIHTSAACSSTVKGENQRHVDVMFLPFLPCTLLTLTSLFMTALECIQLKQ